MAANTFLELNDTPSSYSGSANKFLRVSSAANTVQFWNVSLTDLEDVQALAPYHPQGGQGLIYNSAAGVWRPGTLDVYTAGNGLNKSGLTLNVSAGAGLTANTSGLFITPIANVAGTWGTDTAIPVFTVNDRGQIVSISQVSANVQTAYNLAADYVGNVLGTPGQITVTGGTGNKSNATINLVATGVTAGVYGNTTTVPRITVDTYGRIQNVDAVPISGTSESGAGNTSLAFSAVAVSGQTTLAADQAEDTLTLVAGSGVVITTNANNDSVTFTLDSNAVKGNLSISDLTDVAPITGIQNGQILQWRSANSRFEAGEVSSGAGTIISSDIAPAFPTEDMLWYDEVSGRVYIYYSGTWVDAAPPQSSVDLNNVTGNIVPSADSVYDLGSADRQWRSLYVSGNTVYIAGTPVSIDANGTLLVNNSSTITTWDSVADKPSIPADVSDLTDTQGLLGQLSITVPGNTYKGFGARYGRVYANSNSDELTVSKIVIFKDTASAATSTIHPTSSQDDFAVSGLADSDIVAMFVLYGDTNDEKSLDTLRAFARTAIDTVILNGGVEGSVNTIAAMRTAFYDNINTLTAAAGGLVENFEFFPDSNNTDIWPENSIDDGGNDQYDTANYINTNLDEEISYNGGMIVENAASQFGAGSKYVVVYNSSIFGIFATGSSATTISTSGNSGADGNSTTDTGALFEVDRTYDPALTNLTLTNDPLRAIPVVFIKADNGDEVDVIIEDDSEGSGVGITRGVQNGIYNPYREEEWDSDVSPAGTLWSVGNTDDLSDVESRTYTNFYAAYGNGGLGNKVPGSTAVMYVPDNEKYYLIQWNSWTQNANGGGFAYTRTEIDVAQVEEGLRFSDGTKLKSAQGLGRVKSTAPGNRRIEEATGYKEVAVTEVTTSNTYNVVSIERPGGAPSWDLFIDRATNSELEAAIILYGQYGGDDHRWRVTVDGQVYTDDNLQIYLSGAYIIIYSGSGVTLPGDAGLSVTIERITGGDSVVWWNKNELPGGSSNFRGAIIDYHAYTGESTIIGTIHIVDDDGEEHISHQEVQSGSTDGENDDLWVVTSEGQIRYRRIDKEAKTLKVHWTAKVFYGSELYD
jgi:hypothetical protein